MSDKTVPSLKTWIRSAEKNNGSLPEAEKLALWGKVSVDEAQKALEEYVEPKTKQAPKPTDQVPKADASTIESRPVVQTTVEGGSLHSLPRQIIKAGTGFLAIASMVWAWSNVRSFFSFAPGWEYLIATVVTGILFIFPQAAPLLPKWSAMKAITWPSFGAALLLCMITTVSSNYTNRQALMDSMLTVRSAVTQAEQVSSLVDSDRNRMQEQYKSDSLALSKARAKLDALEYGKGSYWTVFSQVNKLEKAVAADNQILAGMASELKVQSKVLNTVVKKDFYGWIESVTGWPAEQVEFWVGMIPPLIVDVAGPVAARLALFL